MCSINYHYQVFEPYSLICCCVSRSSDQIHSNSSRSGGYSLVIGYRDCPTKFTQIPHVPEDTVWLSGIETVRPNSLKFLTFRRIQFGYRVLGIGYRDCPTKFTQIPHVPEDTVWISGIEIVRPNSLKFLTFRRIQFGYRVLGIG
ncbi:unnamed protein product [Adineta ricciae]|uniref:Uncharacterized protein n=1 Tax=Adineta ricciae TaxID=249248 RepID=A0A814JJB6_ADIRI|nr:unnamed protein product [Adineta ricciae]